MSMSAISNLYRDIGDHDKAEQYALTAVDIFRESVGKEHPFYAMSLHNLGNIYRDLGAFAKAEPLLNESVQTALPSMGKEHQLRYLFKQPGAFIYGSRQI